MLRVEVGFLRSNDTDNCAWTLKLTLLDGKVKASRENVSSLTRAQIVEGSEFVRSSLGGR